MQRHKSVFATSTTNAEALQLPDFKDGDGMIHVRIATTMARPVQVSTHSSLAEAVLDIMKSFVMRETCQSSVTSASTVLIPETHLGLAADIAKIRAYPKQV